MQELLVSKLKFVRLINSKNVVFFVKMSFEPSFFMASIVLPIANSYKA